MKRGSFSNLQDLLGDHEKAGSGGAAAAEEAAGGAPPRAARLVVVVNQLPLRARPADGGEWHYELDQEALPVRLSAALPDGLEPLFVGQLPKDVNVDPMDQDRVERQLKSELNCVPVFISKPIKDRFYTGMCKQVMWPLFHYVLPLKAGAAGRFDRNLWQAYISANRKFVDSVVAHMDPARDYVWVHDYHLLAFPTLLRKHFHSVRCGFFLHSPFPSSEIFRAFPMREALLRGLLNADLIGFHTFDYARHFLSCCSRILGLDFQSKRGNIELEVLGRRVCVKILPTGVEPDRLGDLLRSPGCLQRCQELAVQHAGRTVLVGVDDLDDFKGLDFKLAAFEELLETHETLVGKVVFVQAVNPARSDSDETNALRAHLLHTVERINGKYSTPAGPAIEFTEAPCPPQERAALYAVADVCVLTAVRDGLNLHPNEYVAIRQHARSAQLPGGGMLTGPMSGPVGPSCLVVSEFAGCSASLSGALRVNPWSVQDVADSMYRAITMQEHERKYRHDNNYRYVSHHTVAHWARSYVTALKSVTAELSSKRSYGLGFGLGFRVVAVDPKFKKLDVREALTTFGAAQRRAILLDYDGTLTTQRGCSVDLAPSPAVMKVLAALTEDPRNFVCIVSGRGRVILDEWFAGVPRLALAAEHGFFRRRTAGDSWETGSPSGGQAEIEWRAVARPIMESYTESTDGSYIQDKESSLVWHFRDADPDFGSWQAKELVEHLEGLLVGAPVEVHSASTVVEVKPKGTSKGVAVDTILGELTAGGPPLNWVLCVGDDRSDEEMFASLGKFAEQRGQSGAPLEVYPCTVGQKPSQARYYVNDSMDVLELLQSLHRGSHVQLSREDLEGDRKEEDE